MKNKNKDKNIDFGNYATQSEMLLYSFRYALGRRSYSVSTVAEVILLNWNNLRDCDKKLIQKEIQEAIDGGYAGNQIDINIWKTLLD